jgi:hypothetical protein
MRKNMTTKRSFGFSVALLAAMLAAFSFAQNKPAPKAAASQAQQPYLITIVRVQPAMLTEFQDLMKDEVVPALKKGGVTRYGVWMAATFGEVGEFMLTRPIKDLAELDDPTNPIVKALGQDAATALRAKVLRLITSSRTFMITPQPDISSTPKSGYEPKLMLMVANNVTPGRTAEFEKGSKDLLAVISKTNAKALLSSKVSLGGDANGYLSLVLFDSFTDMNRFPAAFTKAAAAVKLAPESAGIVIHREYTTFRYVPELSIRQPAQ